MTQQNYRLNLQTIRSGYDRKTAWGQARVGAMPGGKAVVTMQKLMLSGSDVFYKINAMFSSDSGRTWTDPQPQDGLDRFSLDGETVACPCDGTPTWHEATGKMLITGHLALYQGDHLKPPPYPRQTWYSVLDEATNTFGSCQTLDMPDDPRFYNSGAGCAQRVDLPDGDILLPVYHADREAGVDTPKLYQASVLRCSFDGQTLACREAGQALSCPDPRGFCEPSLIRHGGKFYLTLRNDVRGYVTAGDDGLNFESPRPWTFDDGEELGNYNTQQHWLSHADGLFLAYTRRAHNNDHVFRHRAPIFIAQVDPQRLCVIRDTERIVIPERGARLGNFGVCAATPAESWVLVSEWMQTTKPNPYDSTVCERYGADNAIFLARLAWC